MSDQVKAREFWLQQGAFTFVVVDDDKANPSWQLPPFKVIEYSALLSERELNRKLANHNADLTAKLEEAENVLRSMHIDTMAWNIQHTEPEILAGWHESNNEKIESYLSKKKVGIV